MNATQATIYILLGIAGIAMVVAVLVMIFSALLGKGDRRKRGE